jgi:hypothetical protein
MSAADLSEFEKEINPAEYMDTKILDGVRAVIDRVR